MPKAEALLHPQFTPDHREIEGRAARRALLAILHVLEQDVDRSPSLRRSFPVLSTAFLLVLRRTSELLVQPGATWLPGLVEGLLA